MLGQYENGGLVYKGHVTLGVSGEAYRALVAAKKTTEPPMPVPAGHEKTVWLLPKLVCTVRYMEKTAAGTLRQPVFKGWRRDKTIME